MTDLPSKRIARIAITPGEPAGIGPDILIQLAQRAQTAELIAVADPELLLDRAKQLNLPLTIRYFDPNSKAQCSAPAELCVEAIKLKSIPRAGCGTPDSAPYVIQTLDRATQLCQQDITNALVTGPINKHLINQGVAWGDSSSGNHSSSSIAHFSGHTEYLAAITHTPLVVMMLSTQLQSSNRPLRVALVTTHLPLRNVADAIQPEMLEQTITILHHDLVHKFGINNPAILVCGLNPHAGEQGDLGDEELRIIEPCLAKLRERGINLSPPLPADTLFTTKYLNQADAVLAMYHDQGLPVLKSHGFGQAVNITLGLPIIRTSVDHGTAFDLAGTGKADTGSLQAAIDTAIILSEHQQDRYKNSITKFAQTSSRDSS